MSYISVNLYTLQLQVYLYAYAAIYDWKHIRNELTRLTNKIARQYETVLCPIEANSNTIELTVHISFYFL